MIVTLLQLIHILFTLYSFAIIARSLLPWFRVSRYHPAMQFLIRITEPMLAPLRRYIRPVGNIDFTPMVALLILWVAEQMLQTLLRSLAY